MTVFTWILMINGLFVLGALMIPMLMEIRPRFNVLWGVALPMDVLDHPAINSLRTRYTRQLLGMTLAAGLLLWGVLNVRAEEFRVIGYLLWVFACIGLSFVPYRWTRRALSALKVRHDWQLESSTVVHIDTRASAHKHTYPVKPMWFILPLLTALGIVLLRGTQSMELLGVTLLIILVAGGLYIVNRRTRVRAYTRNTDINIHLNHVIRRRWSIVTVAAAQMGSIAGVLNAWVLNDPSAAPAYMTLTMGTAAVLVMLLILMDAANKRMIAALTANAQTLAQDDDADWSEGTLYKNPRDQKLFVPKRVGIGFTINTGHPRGKALFAVVMAAVVLLVGGIMVLLIGLATDQPAIHVDASTVQVKAVMFNYAFDVKDIQDVELTDQVTVLDKTNGAATSSYARGQFTTREYGTVQLYIYRSQPQMVIIHLPDTTVIYNEESTEATLAVYEEIVAVLE